MMECVVCGRETDQSHVSAVTGERSTVCAQCADRDEQWYQARTHRQEG